MTVNLSVFTADVKYIFYGQRSSKVAALPGGFQPAVSGDNQPEDEDESIRKTTADRIVRSPVWIPTKYLCRCSSGSVARVAHASNSGLTTKSA